MTLIDKAEALAPCPFCGGEATFSEGKTGDGKPWHYVECSDCEAMGPGVSYADHNIAVKSALADAWNRRAIPARGVGVPTDCRKWDCYPIEMPITKDGHGPAIPGRDEIASITYEVWDRSLLSHASFDNLPDAINEAMRLSIAALSPAPDATEKGGDAHERSSRDGASATSPGVTAGADAAHVNETPKSEHDGADVLTAAQAREAVLEEAELTVPDEIELYRIIKRSGAKKRIDIARAVSAHLEPMRRAFAALISEART